MSKYDRILLENIALEMLFNDMQVVLYSGISREKAMQEVKKLSDKELISFICDEV